MLSILACFVLIAYSGFHLRPWCGALRVAAGPSWRRRRSFYASTADSPSHFNGRVHVHTLTQLSDLSEDTYPPRLVHRHISWYSRLSDPGVGGEPFSGGYNDGTSNMLQIVSSKGEEVLLYLVVAKGGEREDKVRSPISSRRT